MTRDSEDLDEVTNLDVPLNPASARNVPNHRPAFVYFVRCEQAQAMKIGIAVNPIKRLEQLQVGCPYALTFYAAGWEQDAEAKEAEIHARFASLFIRGEWFRCTDELRQFAQDFARAAREGGATWRTARRFFYSYGNSVPTKTIGALP